MASRSSITFGAAIMMADPALAVAVEPPDIPPGGNAESPNLCVTRSGEMSRGWRPPGKHGQQAGSRVRAAGRDLSRVVVAQRDPTVAGNPQSGKHRGCGAEADERVAFGATPRGALRQAEPGRADPEALVEMLARPLQVVAGRRVASFRTRSSIGSISSATASSSIALSSAENPGASPGARMKVVGGRFSGTIFWLMAVRPISEEVTRSARCLVRESASVQARHPFRGRQ